MAIKRGIIEPPSYYTTLSKKIVDFCVTWWTTRTYSLIPIDVNHMGLITPFVTTLSDKAETPNLDAELRKRFQLCRKYVAFTFRKEKINPSMEY